MKRILAAVACAALPGVAIAAADTFTLDPLHTFTYFSVEHFGLSNQFGRFDRNTGKVTLDRAAKTGTMEVTIDAASIATGDSGRTRSRDDVLRSGDFFNAAEFPRVTFKSTRFTFNGDVPSSIEGDLALVGTTRPVTLTVERFRCNPPQATRKERCGGNATTRIKRSDFGMKYGIPSIGDEVTLMIVFEADKD
jgi:polyisoprenoid-binding protein YceI